MCPLKLDFCWPIYWGCVGANKNNRKYFTRSCRYEPIDSRLRVTLDIRQRGPFSNYSPPADASKAEFFRQILLPSVNIHKPSSKVIARGKIFWSQTTESVAFEKSLRNLLFIDFKGTTAWSGSERGRAGISQGWSLSSRLYMSYNPDLLDIPNLLNTWEQRGNQCGNRRNIFSPGSSQLHLYVFEADSQILFEY